MFLALLIIIPCFLYLGTAGAVKTKAAQLGYANCRSSAHRDYRDKGCAKPNYHDGIFEGIFWPLYLPFTIGSILADSDKRQEQKSKAKQREIEQRIERANLEKKAIEQERRNLDNSIRNMEIANNIGSRS